MEILKKSIAFYCCTNGLGHFKRVNEVSKYLSNELEVTIYCSTKQVQKLGKLPNVKYIEYSIDNIRWDLVTSGNIDQAIKLYFKWFETYRSTVGLYDIVVSDNLPVLLLQRKDVILMGSFLWKDVFYSRLGDNKLTEIDTQLLSSYSPTLITNEYVETQSVKTYKNKVSFGFGCEERLKVISDIKYTLIQYPTVNYLTQYTEYLDNVRSRTTYPVIDTLSTIDNVKLVGRPGVGTITHCVEYNIPLIALYSMEDSQEIIELADTVERLKIGIKCNVDEPFDIYKIDNIRSNVNFCYGEKLQKNGYSKIAKFLLNGQRTL